MHGCVCVCGAEAVRILVQSDYHSHTNRTQILFHFRPTAAMRKKVASNLPMERLTRSLPPKNHPLGRSNPLRTVAPQALTGQMTREAPPAVLRGP